MERAQLCVRIVGQYAVLKEDGLQLRENSDPNKAHEQYEEIMNFDTK